MMEVKRRKRALREYLRHCKMKKYFQSCSPTITMRFQETNVKVTEV